MSASFILATEDPALLRAWWAFVPAGRAVLTWEELRSTAAPNGVPIVLVLDAAVRSRLPASMQKVPTILVGPGGSAGTKELLGGAKVYLTYDESKRELGAMLPLVEEIAESSAALAILDERSTPGAQPKSVRASDPEAVPGLWELFERCIESLDSRDRLLEEFARAFRAQVGTSHVLFFLRGESGFHAHRGDGECRMGDPMIEYLKEHPAVLDGRTWPEPVGARAEMSTRSWLMQWSARLIVPVHENGNLQALVALGLRDDGRSYREEEFQRARLLARILRYGLAQSAQIGRLASCNEAWLRGDQRQPGIILLGLDDPLPPQIPGAVRSVINEVKRDRETRRLEPELGHPLRASVGMMADGRGLWVFWEDASAELAEIRRKERTARLGWLHDIALTLNHELGNALVSLTALRHNPGAETNSPVMLSAIRRDIANLESINRHLSSLPTLSEVTAERADLRMLLWEVGRRLGVGVEAGPSVVMTSVVPKLIDFALESIIESIAENRPELGKKELLLQLRPAGTAEQPAAVIGIRGKQLVLEGILPEPELQSAPSHGRIAVFIAKEVILLHGGEIRASTTGDVNEILISLRNW